MKKNKVPNPLHILRKIGGRHVNTKKFNMFFRFTRRGVVVVLCGGVVLFVIANMIASWQIPHLFVPVSQEEEKAVVEALQRARFIPEFDIFMRQQESKYPGIRSKVYADRIHRENMIKELETIIGKNPNATEALYALSVLYKEEGNNTQASLYFDRARAIDPTIGMSP